MVTSPESGKRIECDAEGHPLDPADSLLREPPNQEWEFRLDHDNPLSDDTQGILCQSRIKKGNCSSCRGGVGDIIFDAERLLLRMQDRLRQLQRQHTAATVALTQCQEGERASIRTELAYLDQMIVYKKSLVKSAERVVRALTQLAERMPDE